MVFDPQKIPVQKSSRGGKKNTPTPNPTPTNTPSPTPTVTPGINPAYDLDNDGDIDGNDYLIFIPLYSQKDVRVDYNQDTYITVLDFNLFKIASGQ